MPRDDAAYLLDMLLAPRDLPHSTNVTSRGVLGGDLGNLPVMEA